MRRAVLAALGLALMLTAGCGVPRGAALSREVLAASDEAPSVAVYPVTRAFLPVVAAWPAPAGPGWVPRGAASGGAASGGDIRIAPFDTLSLVVWDSEGNSLFSSQAERGGRIEALRVTDAGEVFVPYLGYLSVAGRTPDEARRLLERELAEIVPSAQLQLSVTPGAQGSVTLVGGVARPGSYPLPQADFTVLDLIGQGGGPAEMRNPQVRLVRGGRSYATSYRSLLERPARNAVLRGSDRVALVEDGRSFRALGAAGQERLIPFDRERLTAADALGLMEGLNDSRADPRGLLILREYPAGAVRPGPGGPDDARAVFTIDLTSADGLFGAGRFSIQPGDTVLVTEAPVTTAQTAAGILGALLGVTDRLAN